MQQETQGKVYPHPALLSSDMPDIALIGERTFLYEKLFGECGLSFQFVSPSLLGSPFLPQYKAVILPTGFANPQYSGALLALLRIRSNISSFVKRGGVLTVFGPMVSEHGYEWLPQPLRLRQESLQQRVRALQARRVRDAARQLDAEAERWRRGRGPALVGAALVGAVER